MATIKYEMTPEDRANALAEAKARGVPPGWTVELDKRKRRKWIAPNGRTCDSIPKALQMSVEMGLLPPDTVIIHHPKKSRGRPPNNTSKSNKSKVKASMSGIYKNNDSNKVALALDLTKPLDPIQGNSINGGSTNQPTITLGRKKKKVDRHSRAYAKTPASSSGTSDNNNNKNNSHNSGKHIKKKRKTYTKKRKLIEEEDSDGAADGLDDGHTEEENQNVYIQDVEEDDDGDDDDDDDDEEDEIEPPTQAETSLEEHGSHLTTVHWNETQMQKVGWKVRVADDKQSDWKEGRIVRYDPCTHKHKIKFVGKARTGDQVDADNCSWLHLRMEDGVQVARKLVWAHVKGYAWWPAMIMESDIHQVREGYAQVEFFGNSEVATIRNVPESLRPFDHGKIDPYISKNKKKRNAAAISAAMEEEAMIQQVRNDAAKWFANKAWERANIAGKKWLGKRIQIFRSDVNYPYGDTVQGRVRQYSSHQKKWLISFELSESTRKKYPAAWINLQSKEHKVRVLEKLSKPGVMDIVPYVEGFKGFDEASSLPLSTKDDAMLAKILRERCKGCIDYWKKGEIQVTCNHCQGTYHIGCLDSPISPADYEKIDLENFVCSKCLPCRGCYQMDIAFGSHPQTLPPTLSFPDNESLDLCSMCVKAYSKHQFCPNCAHSWDDDHFQRVQRQIRWQQAHRPKKRGRKRKYEDPNSPADYHAFTAPISVPNDDPIPSIAKVNPTWYHPETSQWGYTEVDMLTCDSCKLWVHAGCAGITEDDYELTSNGEHPIYSKEFLCRACCRKRCTDLIQKLQQEDNMFLFAEPVTDKMAHNYHDIIKNPMDLQSMLVRAEREEYLNYAWVREMFELMVLNALTFNSYHSAFWNEAKRYYKACLQNVWKSMGKAAPPTQYEESIKQNFEKASEVKQLEDNQVAEDTTTEKKDLVAGTQITTITLPDLREQPPDQPSCVPCKEIKLKSVDAYYSCWMDSCFVCASSGASDTMLFCVDCGEAFHSFCVNAPVHSMDASSVAGWRCANCKICEISGDAPQDELKTLFCEMCDRGFSLDLLDPPLSKAPAGLWICGQCVDCQKCHNKLEPKGPSLKHWSRDPQLCYRCGGCDGLVDEYKKTRKCGVCSIVYRDEDTDLVTCSDCDMKVHLRCDPRAHALKDKKRSISDNGNCKKSGKYQCPSCSKRRGVKKHTAVITRGHMYQDAWKVVQDGILPCTEVFSPLELQAKLMEQIDWKTRNLWRDEYRKVVLEGVRFLQRAKEQFGDPRYLMDRFWQENVDLPHWMGQRATRFIHIAKKLRLESLGFSARRIEFCVLISKLAASWLKVSCRIMGLKIKKHIKGHDRVVKLLIPPDDSGTLELSFDPIRCERNRNIINKDEWLERFEPVLRPVVERQVFGNQDVAMNSTIDPRETSNGHHTREVTLAKPLCGWDEFVSELDYENKWEDGRECCLCHLCGDDDAGLPDQVSQDTNGSGKLAIAHVGRLLPMGDGLWVHASCALWSSETWESESAGAINAMEKARSRGSQLRCFGCGRPGATVGCVKTNCPHNYHFSCAFACGAAFTPAKQMYCSQHKDVGEEFVTNPSIELMKTLVIAAEKSKTVQEKEGNESESSLFHRVGALVLHSLGQIEQEADGFHTADYIMPPGYIATRIFWSMVKPKVRTVYVLRVEKTNSGKPLFSVTSADNPGYKMKSHSVNTVYKQLMDKVLHVNEKHFSNGDLFSRLPTARLSRKGAYGLNGPQFFGFGLDHIRRLLEHCPGVEATVASIVQSSPQYKFCFLQPSEESIIELQRQRAALAAEKKLENTSGCARTEGMTAVTRAGGSDRITRALVRSAAVSTDAAVTKNMTELDQSKADRFRTQSKYKELQSVPIEERLVAKRSHIHGWGLFTKRDLPENSMIVEYMGEIVHRSVADAREKAYEISGEGSCYMFRLDLERIVDATKIGCMARFMNHSCQPNAYAKVITVETEYGQDKKIMIFAHRDIKAGEEITYDYKFQREDGSLKCTCGAPNCIGRMN